MAEKKYENDFKDDKILKSEQKPSRVTWLHDLGLFSYWTSLTQVYLQPFYSLSKNERSLKPEKSIKVPIKAKHLKHTEHLYKDTKLPLLVAACARAIIYNTSYI